MPPPGFSLHIFPALDGTFLNGINSRSNEEDPRKNKMLGWIAYKLHYINPFET
jgi:hypothetical protein